MKRTGGRGSRWGFGKRSYLWDSLACILWFADFRVGWARDGSITYSPSALLIASWLDAVPTIRIMRESNSDLEEGLFRRVVLATRVTFFVFL